MALFTTSVRRTLKPLAGAAIIGASLLGVAGVASADSGPVGQITPGACIGGTVNRPVSVIIQSNASFITAIRVHVVSGTVGGPIVDTQTIEIPQPVITIPFSRTFEFALPAGTYYFDWEDRSGDGVTWSGRHSTLSDFYAGVFAGTETDVAECVVATTTTVGETTTTAATTTSASTATTAATTTTAVVNPPTTATAATTTTVGVGIPTTGAASTTAVVQTTAAASANTLPATGANNTPFIALGVAFLGLGTVALLATKRRTPALES